MNNETLSFRSAPTHRHAILRDFLKTFQATFFSSLVAFYGANIPIYTEFCANLSTFFFLCNIDVATFDQLNFTFIIYGICCVNLNDFNSFCFLFLLNFQMNFSGFNTSMLPLESFWKRFPSFLFSIHNFCTMAMVRWIEFDCANENWVYFLSPEAIHFVLLTFLCSLYEVFLFFFFFVNYSLHRWLSMVVFFLGHYSNKIHLSFNGWSLP